MKDAVWVLAILALGALGWLARDARLRAAEARAEIAALQIDLDEAKAQASADSLRADSLAHRSDSLATERMRVQAAAEARARRLARRADSLALAIEALVPPGEGAEQVAALLGQMRASYEERITDLEELLASGRLIEDGLRAELVVRERVAVSLRSALALAEQQRDRCMDATTPGLLARIRANVGPMSGAVVIGLVVGLVAG